MRYVAPRYLDAGDAGLVVEFGDEIDEGINRAVVATAGALEERREAGIIEVVPTYRSFLVIFDPLALSKSRLIEIVEGLDASRPAHAATGIRWRVPVLYGGEAGVDLAEVADLHGLSEAEVVALHSGTIFRVYMLGFSPGFAYLGGLPAALHTSRRTDPRPETPPRSISIGGQQAAISPPIPVPSGWRLLGRTPVRSYDPQRTSRPFLFSPGDQVRFEPITPSEYERACAAAEAGEIVAVQERWDD